jgi:hypothetical protein
LSLAKPRQDAKRLQALIAAYREGLALAAVLVISGGSTIRIVAAGHSGDGAPAPGEAITARWWCRRAFHAECIVEAATRSLRRAKEGPGDAIQRASASISRAATRHEVLLQSDESLVEEATLAITRLEDEIERQKQAGTLKSVNAAYRQYRLDATARGERVMRYADWMDRYKEKLVREIAVNLR